MRHQIRMARLFALALSANAFGAAAQAGIEQRADVVCSYAPSQSNGIAAVSGAAGGAAAMTAGLAAALGMSAVAHSSGALILTGSGGYIAGTLGTAVVAPTIVVVGAVVGGTAISVELLCAPKNHPAEYKKVLGAGREFGRRASGWTAAAKEAAVAAPEAAGTFTAVKISSVKASASSLYRRVFAKNAEVARE